MHFCYVVGNGSKWENNELRYSLRSIAKYTKDPSVTIVGSAPAWVKNVRYIPMPEPVGHRLFRTNVKLLSALPYLPDGFVYMNDDFYLMQPLDYIPVIHDGPLRDAISNLMGSGDITVHLHTLQETFENLLNYTDEPLNYELHQPMFFMRDLVYQACAVFPLWNLQIKSIYGNWAHQEGERWRNAKINTEYAGGPFYSTGEYPSQKTQNLFAERFPDPSPFEAA